MIQCQCRGRVLAFRAFDPLLKPSARMRALMQVATQLGWTVAADGAWRCPRCAHIPAVKAAS